MADNEAIVDAGTNGDFESPTTAFDVVRTETNKSVGTESTKETDLSDAEDQPTSSLEKIERSKEDTEKDQAFTPIPMTGIAITDDEEDVRDVKTDNDDKDEITASSKVGNDGELNGIDQPNPSDTNLERGEEGDMDRTDDIVAKAMAGGLAAAAGLKDKEAKMTRKKKSGKLSRMFNKKSKPVEKVPPLPVQVEEVVKEEKEKEEQTPKDVTVDEEPMKERSSTFVAWQSPSDSKFSTGATLDEAVEAMHLSDVAGPEAEEKGFNTLRALEFLTENTTEEKKPEIHEENVDDISPLVDDTEHSDKAVPLCGVAVSGLIDTCDLPFFKKEQSNDDNESKKELDDAGKTNGEEKPAEAADPEPASADLAEKANEEESTAPDPSSASTEVVDKKFTEEATPETTDADLVGGHGDVEETAAQDKSSEEKNDNEKESFGDKEVPDKKLDIERMASFDKMSYGVLKRLCKKYALDAKGSKATIVERLEEHFDDGQHSI